MSEDGRCAARNVSGHCCSSGKTRLSDHRVTSWPNARLDPLPSGPSAYAARILLGWKPSTSRSGVERSNWLRAGRGRLIRRSKPRRSLRDGIGRYRSRRSQMIIRFNEQLPRSVSEVHSYFETPADWTRLYGLAGEVRDYGDGWFCIPLQGFPFGLQARNVVNEPDRVRWILRGFWRGEGEIRLTATAEGIRVEGYEKISMRWARGLSRLLEKAFLERQFRRIWQMGWDRLRRDPSSRTPARKAPPTSQAVSRTRISRS